MPRNVLFLDCILESLDGRNDEDLIRWTDYDERIFEISFRHGNSRKGGRSQFEAAKVWLAWDQKKNRLPEFSQMSTKKINMHLTEVRQRFRQALKSQVEAGILKRLPSEKGKERFQIRPIEEREIGKMLKKERRRRQSSCCSSSSSSPCSPTSSFPNSPCTSPLTLPSPTFTPETPNIVYILVLPAMDVCQHSLSKIEDESATLNDSVCSQKADSPVLYEKPPQTPNMENFPLEDSLEDVAQYMDTDLNDFDLSELSASGLENVQLDLPDAFLNDISLPFFEELLNISDNDVDSMVVKTEEEDDEMITDKNVEVK